MWPTCCSELLSHFLFDNVFQSLATFFCIGKPFSRFEQMFIHFFFSSKILFITFWVFVKFIHYWEFLSTCCTYLFFLVYIIHSGLMGFHWMSTSESGRMMRNMQLLINIIYWWNGGLFNINTRRHQNVSQFLNHLLEILDINNIYILHLNCQHLP